MPSMCLCSIRLLCHRGIDENSTWMVALVVISCIYFRLVLGLAGWY